MRRFLAIFIIIIGVFAVCGASECDSIKVFFTLNKAAFEPALDKNAESMEKFIDSIAIAAKSGNQVRVVVYGYASPDGAFNNNDRLADRRCAAIADYISRHAGIPMNDIRSCHGGVAWDGLRELVLGNPDAMSRDKVLRILNQYLPGACTNRDKSDQCLKELMAIDEGRTYEWMLDNLFPKLRFALAAYTGVASGRSGANAASVGAGNLEVTSVEPLDGCSSKVNSSHGEAAAGESYSDGASSLRSGSQSSSESSSAGALSSFETASNGPLSASESFSAGSQSSPESTSADSLFSSESSSAGFSYTDSADAVALPPLHRLALKTNLLYDAALLPNIELEWRINKHWSLSLEGGAAWWGKYSKDRSYRLAIISPEVRRWIRPRAPWRGFYVGAFAGGGIYDFEKPTKGYRGEGLMAGLSAGYMWPVSRCLSFEAEVGAGYLYTRYKEYQPIDGHHVYQRTKDLNFFGPLKVKFALVWRFWDVNKSRRHNNETVVPYEM